MMCDFTISTACAVGLLAGGASASVITDYVQNWEGWQEAVGTYTTCDFIGITPGTLMTDQYENSGVTFSANSVSFGWSVHSPALFPQDGWGVQTNALYLELTFTQPIHAIGMHVGLATHISLLSGDTQDTIFAQLLFGTTTTGLDNFTGLVSEIAFDKVWISTYGWESFLFLDNLYFSTVPAPSGLGLLLMAMAGGSRRRGR